MEILQPNERSLSLLERGEIDMVLLPERYLSRSHPSEELFSDDFTCIVWNGNTEVGQRIDEAEFLRLGHVATSFGSHQHFAFDEWFFNSIGLNRRIEVMCSSFSMLPQFVIDTRRIATLQRRLALQLARYYPVRVIEPPVSIPRIVECMQWNPSNDTDPSHLWLRAMLRSAAHDNFGEAGAYGPQTPVAPLAPQLALPA